MSLVELLCALLILMLVSTGLVTGVQLGVNQYAKSMRSSESKILYSTLSSIISNELRYSTDITVDASGNLVDFQAVSYGQRTYKDSTLTRSFRSMTDEDTYTAGYGKLYYGTANDADTKDNLLGAASYTYGLTAMVSSIVYDSENAMFTVQLDIGWNQESYYSGQFQVHNLAGTTAKVR